MGDWGSIVDDGLRSALLEHSKSTQIHKSWVEGLLILARSHSMDHHPNPPHSLPNPSYLGLWRPFEVGIPSGGLHPAAKTRHTDGRGGTAQS